MKPNGAKEFVADVVKVYPFFKTLKAKLAILLAVLVVIALISLVVWRLAFVTFVENHELAFAYNKLTGEVDIVNKTGWVTRTPIQYAVHTIDLRPYQVTISANSRVLNAKLVRFNPAGLRVFIEWHGRTAADGKNGTRNLLEILKSYAFDVDGGKSCPFLTVVNEIQPMSSRNAAANNAAQQAPQVQHQQPSQQGGR